MAKQVFTGWRTVTPGACECCGYDDGWYDCDGRGGVACECNMGVDELCEGEPDYDNEPAAADML